MKHAIVARSWKLALIFGILILLAAGKASTSGSAFFDLLGPRLSRVFAVIRASIILLFAAGIATAMFVDIRRHWSAVELILLGVVLLVMLSATGTIVRLAFSFANLDRRPCAFQCFQPLTSLPTTTSVRDNVSATQPRS